MLKIRLNRRGKKNQPSYRVVVIPARSKRNGKYIQSIGFYNPLSKPPTIKIDRKAYKQWLQKGAQPTTRVKKLFQKIKNEKTD